MLSRKFRFIEPTRSYRELRILSEISEHEDISQRSLAEHALLGPTMVNRYVSQLQEEGLIEVEGETNRSFRYELTEAGTERRDELFFQVSKEVVQLYGLIKKEFHRRLFEHAQQGAKRVVLFGAAETAEICCAAAEGSGIEIVGVVDNNTAKHVRRFGALQVASPAEIESFSPDTVLITSYGHTDEIYEQIRHLEERGIRVVRV